MRNSTFHPLKEADLILETERLVLRPLGLEDLDLTKVLFTDPDVMRFVGGVVAEAKLPAGIEKAVKRGAGGRLGVWCITDRHSGEKLGRSILLPLPIETSERDWSLVRADAYPDAEIEVGYILGRNAWGRGIATETCRRLLQFGFEMTDLDEIVAVTDPDNLASQNVLTKCGLRREGTRRAYGEDLAGFRVAREEFERFVRS